jgi:hypothetical protein
MEKGDIDNSVPPRAIVIFNDLIGGIPKSRTVRVEMLRTARRWKAVAEAYDINLPVRAKLHDLTWRHNLRVDCVLVDHPKVAEAMEGRFNRMNLAISNVYAVNEVKEVADRLAYMPEVLWVIFGNPEWMYAFGRKGRLGLDSL